MKHPSDQKTREIFGKEYGCEFTERQKVYAAELKRLEEESKELLKKAEAGEVAAMVKVASRYQSTSDGLPQDFKQAFHWAEKAAKKGNTEAMGLIAALYNRGDGVEKDDEQAFFWSLKAAEKGEAHSQYFVGLCFYNGQGTEPNLGKAVSWLGKAMDAGHEDARSKLVEMFSTGELQAIAFKGLVDRLKKLERQRSSTP